MRILTYVGAIILVLLIFNIVFLPARRDRAENLAYQAVSEHQIFFKSKELVQEERLYLLNKLDVSHAFISEEQSVWECYDRATNELRWKKTTTGKILVFEQQETILEVTKGSSGIFFEKIQRIDLQTGEIMWIQPLKLPGKVVPTVDLSRTTTLVIEKEFERPNRKQIDTFSHEIWSLYDTKTGSESFVQALDSNNVSRKMPLRVISSAQIPRVSINIAYFSQVNLFHNPNDTIPFFRVKNGTILDAEYFWVFRQNGISDKTRVVTIPKSSNIRKVPNDRQGEFIAIHTQSGILKIVEDQLYVSEFISFKNQSSYRRHRLHPIRAIRSGNYKSYQGLPIYSYNYGSVDLEGERKWMFSQENELVQIKEMKKEAKLKELKIPNSRKTILKIIEEDGFFYFYIREKYPTEYDPTIITQKYKLPIDFESE